MVNIESGKDTGTFSDVVFSMGINFIQSTAVRYRVSKNKTYMQRRGPRATGDFQRQLRDLGLTPERLWWGLMTLFPRKAEFLLGEIEKHPPKRLLEVGCGTSTAIFAALAEKYEFTVLSLENHGGTIKYVQSILDGLPCSQRVTIQRCGFVQRSYANGDKYRWYDADLESGGTPFDFVLIDGPITKPVGRNGALPEIKPYLAKDHRIYLDDSEREHEKLCIQEWQRHCPGLIVETLDQCFGMARLRIRS